jgi:hypothetical protein
MSRVDVKPPVAEGHLVALILRGQDRRHVYPEFPLLRRIRSSPVNP